MCGQTGDDPPAPVHHKPCLDLHLHNPQPCTNSLRNITLLLPCGTARPAGGCRVLPPAVCPAAAAAAHGGCRGSSAPAALPSQPSTTLSTACSPLSGRAGHGGRRLGVAVAAAPAGGAGLEPQQQPGPGQGVAAGAAAGGVAGAAPAAAPRDLSLEPFKVCSRGLTEVTPLGTRAR